MEKLRIEADQWGYDLITTYYLCNIYKNDPAFILVDFRYSNAFLKGHLKGALNFPMKPTWWSRFGKKRGLKLLLGPDQDRSIVFY